MLRMRGRLHKLEQTLVPSKGPRLRMRLVMCAMTKAADLAASTCQRTLANGVLTEVVHLDGDRSELSNEQLEHFIESCPIQEAAAAW
jgi:hypothetical protein